jgi:hypothetical protein
LIRSLTENTPACLLDTNRILAIPHQSIRCRTTSQLTTACLGLLRPCDVLRLSALLHAMRRERHDIFTFFPTIHLHTGQLTTRSLARLRIHWRI